MSGPEKVGELYLEATLRAEQIAAEAKKGEQALQGLSDAAQKTQKDLDKTGDAADGSGIKLSKFGITAGAIGAAMLAVTAKAIDMAQTFDASARRIAVTMDGLGTNLDGLKSVIVAVSRETGTSLEDLSAAGRIIGQNGVASLDEFADRLRLVEQVSKVTGVSMGAVATGIDQVLDAFDLGADQAEEVAAKLFAISKGKVPLEELFAAMEAAAPKLRTLGLGFDVAAQALGQLLSGNTPRQAAQMFKEYADQGEAGAAALRQWAAGAESAIDPTKDLADAVALINDGVDEQRRRALSEHEAALVKWGEAWLPISTRITEAKLALLNFITTRGILSNMDPGNDGNPFTRARRDDFSDVRGGSSSRASSTQPAPRILTPAEIRAAAEAARKATDARRQATEAIAQLERDLAVAQAKLDGPFAGILAGIDAKIAAVIAKTPGMTAALVAQAEALRDAFKAVATDDRIDEILGQNLPKTETNQASPLDRINRDIKDLPDDLEEVSDGVQRVNDRFKQLADTSAAMGTLGDYAVVAANGADELANALRDVGALTPDLEQLLGVISAMADGIGNFANLSGTIADFKLGDATTLDVVGAGIGAASTVASIAGAIASSFGENPEIVAAREALEEMRIALEANTVSLRALDISGENISGANSGIQQFLAEGVRNLDIDARDLFPGNQDDLIKRVTDEMEKFGITMDDLRKLAAELEVPFIELTSATFPQFIQQLGLFGDKLDDITFFATDAAGRLDKARTTIEFTPQTETIGETIAQLIEAAMGDNGPISGFLGTFFEGFNFEDLDSESAEVRNAAAAQFREIIASIFEAITAEGFDISLLGDFTPDEFLAFLSEVLGFIPPIIEDAAGDIETASSLFAQAMASISRAARVFDFSDLEIAGATLNAMAASFPAFADAIAGFDLSTPEGIAAAIESLQAFYSAVEDGAISLDGAGFSVEDLVGAIDLLQGISADAADEVERLAEEERRRSEQSQREAEQAFREQQRRQEEAQREAERAHQEALRRAEEIRRTELAVGSDTLRALEEGFRLFDIEDVSEQLRQLFTVLGSQAPVFQQLLGGLDAGSAGDRAEALQRLRDFYTTNPFGQESGSLSADVVRSQVLSLAALLKQVNEVDITSQGTIGSFAIDRAITTLQGERLEGLLGTANIWAEATAMNTAAMLDLMVAAQSFEGLSAPAIPAAFGLAAGTQIGTMNFYFGDGPAQVVANPASTPALRAFIAEVVEQERLRAMGA